MAEFPKLTMTNKAIEMIAESQLAGNDLIITKVKIGDGQLADGADIKAMTDVVAARLVAPMTDSKLDGGQVTVNFAISNSELEAGFFAREIGIFAKLGEEGAETLYAYTNAGNLCDWIPDKHTPIDSQIVNATIVVGNASNVVVNVSDKAFVTTKDLESHNTASDAHADIRQAIEDIDVSQDIQKHNTDSTAHADKFTQYLPLTGGNITGALSLNDKFVAVSVNGQKADAEGNIDMSGSEGTQLYISAGSYTWTVPDGISKVFVTASAGGGGGGYGERTSSRDGYWEYGGYGGRGANCYKYEISVTAGEEISIIIGAGGGAASAGGTTCFGDKLSLSGGGAGGNSSGEGHPGADAGAASPQSIFTSCPYSAYGAGGNRGGSHSSTYIDPGAGTRGMMLLEWSWLS